ncbi:tRNA isopentenyltransferase [Mollisia scopiformis]|uniref:tRNA dimethylallyltransferase n=1 Tax=Mollisia scopiformis TaxID=149040 RepID=A0A194XIG0_MOLSC|nr:tRNA isopentenyltransferase [Mollisia scopiformis]KUJ20015.1 tRNA isopentenyltransferase [Mollisia scopiformis]
MTPKPPLLIILGATGTGKSQLAINLALRFNGEIINGDAMQMYHGLPIVTNKVTPSEALGIPHHLLSEIPLDAEPWRVGRFRKEASKVIAEIRSRGKIPVVVGGTHYYTQSLLFSDGLVAGDEAGEEEMGVEEIRERWPILEAETGEMLEWLREVDPGMAERWHPRDRRKIRRSLEIFLMTGRKASDIYAEQVARKTETDLSSTLLFWVHADSNVLKKRLDGRVDKMLENGMLDEVKSLDTFLHNQERPIDRTRGIWVSIGWKEFEPYLTALKSGTATEEELRTAFDLSIEQTKAATRQYAKRQTRWIRLKLLPALTEEDALKQLYVLDGTDISQWDENVSEKAAEITEKWLKGEEMPAPEEVCAAAKEILGEVGEVRSEWPRRECGMCGVTAVTEVQWVTHLKSRKHRGASKRVAKKERGSDFNISKSEVEDTP